MLRLVVTEGSNVTLADLETRLTLEDVFKLQLYLEFQKTPFYSLKTDQR